MAAFTMNLTRESSQLFVSSSNCNYSNTLLSRWESANYVQPLEPAELNMVKSACKK